ncbi:MAG: hypothetical protein B6U89_02750 [Desulfurococcales archaeon ex4484_58]|nr:MAG: hypothetical protein B6U89_02750 [Desulfurococcales archaeon ex4484_58]
MPLILIFIAISLSPWFSLWDNALSDLGHAVKSSVAPIFNFALALAGFLVGLFSIKYMVKYSVSKSVLLIIIGFILILIGVYDEVYGELHTFISILFFIMLIVYLVYYGLKDKTPYPVLVAMIQVIVWFIHYTQDIPPGAALPELIAILSYIPFYTYDALKIGE